MQKKNSPIERFLALMLSVLMVFGLMPTAAVATEGSLPITASEAIQCHTEHDAACGYVLAADGAIAIDGVPCDNACEGAHLEGCAYKEAVAQTPAILGADCAHTCDKCAAPSNEEPSREALSNVATGESSPQPILDYSISFDSRNGEAVVNKAVDTATSKAPLPTRPSWTGYTFSGWYTGIDGTGTQIDADTVHTASITVYAKWVTYHKTVRTQALDFTADTPAPAPDQGWDWDETSKTLTLNDASINVANQYAINFLNGATVILQGTNTVAAMPAGSTAIQSHKTLIISGDGTLHAKAENRGIATFNGNITIDKGAIVTAEGSAYGVYADEKLIISGSTVTATARETFTSETADVSISDSTVKAFAWSCGIYASTGITITNSKITAHATMETAKVVETKEGFITAPEAKVTGASSEFVSGVFNNLMQAHIAGPVIMTFGPYIEVAPKANSYIPYGLASSLNFDVTATDFGGTNAPAFAPRVIWTGGNAPAGVTAAFSNVNSVLKISTSTTTPLGKHKFKIVSAKNASTGGDHESKEMTLTVAKGTSKVSIAVTKKPVIKSRAVIGNKGDIFIITATVTGLANEKLEGTVQLETSSTTSLGDPIILEDGVATYEWSNPDAANYTITAHFTASTSNYKNATGSIAQLEVEKGPQEELNFKDVPTSVHLGYGKIDFVTEGGSGTGDTSYASSDTAVIDNDGTVNATGTATITATKTGDNNYLSATATIVITVTREDPYFEGNDLFAVGEPILLINESGKVNAYWDKNSDGEKDANDTPIATQATTGPHSQWNIYGASKSKAMTATGTSQITLHSGGFNAVNGGSKIGGDVEAGAGITRLLRVATTETYGALTGFNKTEYKIIFDLQGGSGDATAHVWQPESAPLKVPSFLAPTKENSTFMGFFDTSGKQYYRENLKAALPSFTANSILTLTPKWSEGTGIFAGRYSHFQVFDCTREPAFPAEGAPFRVSNLGVPFNDASGNSVQMGKSEVKDKIFYFKKTSDKVNPFILYMAEDIDGKNEKVISQAGKIFALGKEGLLFISFGTEKGYFISLAQGLEYGDEITYSSTEAGPVDEATASKHPDSSSTPWSPKESYAVYFNSQGADTLAMPSQISIRSNPAPALLDDIPNIPVKEGYSFGGWYSEVGGLGTKIDINTTLTQNVTAYAKWTSEIEFVDVTLKSGQNLEPSEQFGTNTGVKGTAWTGVVLPKSGYKLSDEITVTVNSVILDKVDYTYSKATGEISISKEKMTANVEIDLTAIPISYTVKYHANGAVDKPSVEQQKITFGTVEYAANRGNMSSIWTFKGWARTGDATTVDYEANAAIGSANPVTLTDGATVSLYAVWDAMGANVALQNGSFEKPVVQGKSPWINLKNGVSGLEWKTTSRDGKHEIVRPSISQSSTNDAFNTRVASEGEQFAELNANYVGSLYQDVKTIPGSTLYWGADHRGRSGTDTMQVWIGSPANIAKALDQYVKGGNNVAKVEKTLLGKIKQKECKSDNTAWENYEGAYEVPAEQSTTTFAFVSVASATGVVSYGNLLDNIYFSFVKPPRRKGIIVRTTSGGSVTVSDGSMASTSVSPDTNEYARSLEYGNVLNLGVQSAAGYTFNGGYINGIFYHTKADFLTASNNMSWTVDENLPDDITILFSKNSTVIFGAQGGAYKAEVTLTASSEPEKLGTPVKKDNKFGGWLIAGTQTVLKAGNTIEYFTNVKTGAVSLQVKTDEDILSYPVAYGIILIAKWSYDDSFLKEVTIKLDYDDGSATTATEQILSSTNKWFSLPTPKSTLYRFVGWRYPMGVVDEPYEAGAVMEYDQNGSKPRVYIGGDINIALEEMLLIAQWVPRQATKAIIKEKPKTSYEYNDSFEPTGLVVTVTYDNGTTQDVAYTDNKNKFTFAPNTTDKLVLADKKVTFTYTQDDFVHQQELPISVEAKKLTFAVTGVSGKIYDGSTSTTGGKIEIIGIAPGDTVTANGIIEFTDKNIGTNKSVNVTNIALSGADAGNYIITDNSVANAATTAEITPKLVGVTWNGTANRAYDGQKSGVYGTPTNIITGDVCNVEVTNGDKINAGTYTATASVDNNNYIINSSSATTSYTIEKARLIAAYEGVTVIYKDKFPAAALKVSVTGFVNGETGATLDAAHYNAPTVPVVDWTKLEVGKYSFTPSGGSATNYSFDYIEGQLNVAERKFDAVIIHDYIGDYDGKAHKINIVNVDAMANNLKITYYTTQEDAEKEIGGTDIATERIDAGTTTVFYRVEADGFSSIVGEGTITINKKPVTAVIDAQVGKVYDGEIAADGVTLKLKDVIAGDNATAKGNVVFTDKNVGTDKIVWASNIIVEGDKKDNYILTATDFTASTTAIITPKKIEITWANGGALIYTGVAKNISAHIPAGNVAQGDSCEVSVTGGKAKNYKDIAYTATATLTNDNYALNNPTYTYTIAKAELSAKFKSEVIVYGEKPTLEVEVTGFVGGETALTAMNYAAPTIKTIIPTAVSAEAYDIELNNNGTADNYTFKLATGQLTINKADMSQSVFVEGYKKEYDGAAHGITVTAPIGSTIEFVDDQAPQSTNNSYTNVGAYAVSYTVSHDNYATVKGIARVEIVQKQLVPKLDAATVQSKTYDKNSIATVRGEAIMLEGIIGNDIVNANAKVEFVDVNVGANKAVNVTDIVLSGAVKDNYDLSAISISNVATTAQITPIEGTLIWSPSPALFTYDGKEKKVTATVSNLLMGDACEIAITSGSATIPNTYTAIAASLSNTNYGLPVANTHSFTIKNATIIGIEVIPTVKNYDGIFSDGVTVTKQLSTDVLYYSTTNENGPWSASIPQIGVEDSVTNIWVKVEREYHDPLVLGSVQAKVKATPKVKIDKPIFDAENAKHVTVGGMVTQGVNKIDTQSFSIRKEGAKAYTPLNVGREDGVNTIYLQSLQNLTESTVYELLLTATDEEGVVASETLSFRTKAKTPPPGEIEGGVTGTIEKITVTLEMGNTIVAIIKDLKSGDKFTFKALQDGEYNVVATDTKGRRVTMMASVKDGGTTILSVMVIGQQQSSVKVMGAAPPVAVDGLQDLFDSDTYNNDADAKDIIQKGGTVEIRLTADEAKELSEIDDIKAGVGSDTVGVLIDLKADMIITPTGEPSIVKNITTVEGLLTIAVPLPKEAIGKTGYKMYRHHLGNVEQLRKLAVGETPVECSFLVDGTYAYIYSSKFSTYALTHLTPPPTGGSTGDGSSFYQSYKVYLKASAGGSFIPGNAQFDVREGDSFGVDIIADKGYAISNVAVNGTDMGSIATYVGRNVRSDYSITATFKKIASAGDNTDVGSGTTTDPVTPEKPAEDTKPDNIDDLIQDLEQKRDEVIDDLPSSLTDEQRDKAIEEINSICDVAEKAIVNAKSVNEASELFNQAVRNLQEVLNKLGAELPSAAPTGKKAPFVLASALLAILFIILAALTIFKRIKRRTFKS